MDKYIVKLAYDTFQVPFYYWNGTAEYALPMKEGSIAKYIQAKRNDLLSYAQEYQQPALYVDTQMVCNCVFLDKEGGLYVLGPFLRWKMLESQVREFHYVNQIQTDYLPEIMDINKVIQEVALLFHAATGGEINYNNGLIPYEKKILTGNEIPQKMLPSSEPLFLSANPQNKTYEAFSANAKHLEDQMLEAIENGDLDGLHQLTLSSQLQSIRVGVLSQDERKNHEYLMVSFITLACRAAMRGGLSPAIAYAESDIYLQQLSHARTIQEMNRIPVRMQQNFAQQVHDLKTAKQASSLVEEAKNYIHMHLREPLQITDIADAVQVSHSYLSHRFSKEEGITLKQYLQKRRCHYAANMLLNSKYPISVIAEYFCFSSQSHFGEVFRKQYGMTPMQYRHQGHSTSNSST